MTQRHWNFGMSSAGPDNLSDATILATSARTFVNPDNPSAVPPPYTAGPATVVAGGPPLGTRDYGFESAYATDMVAPGFSASRSVSPLVIPSGGATQTLTVTFSMADPNFPYMGLIVGEVAGGTWTYNGITPATAPVSVDRNGTGSVAVGVGSPLTTGQTYTLSFTGQIPNATGQPFTLKPRVGFLASNAETRFPDTTAQGSYSMDDPVLQGTATFTFDSANPDRTYTIWSGTNYSFGLNYLPGEGSVPPITTPKTTSDCKNGGWQSLFDDLGHPFTNQGDCVSFVATGGKNKAKT